MNFSLSVQSLFARLRLLLITSPQRLDIRRKGTLHVTFDEKQTRIAVEAITATVLICHPAAGAEPSRK